MELRQLRAFVVVVDELHFGRAAARLYLSTSALSERIQGLERDIGVALFDRSHRGVALTGPGREFLVEVERALADLEVARSVARRAARAGDCRLRLGWPATGSPAWAEPIYAGYRAAHPEVAVKLVVDHSGPHARAVAEGRLDVAFISGPQDTVAMLGFRPLRQGPLGLACAAAHPLAKQSIVTLEHLRAALHVAFPRQDNPPLYRRVYEELLEGAPHLVEHATSLEAVLGIVAAGEAVALRVEDSLPTMTCEPVIYRPLEIPGFTFEFGLTWRTAAPSPLVESFVGYASALTRMSDYPDCPESSDMHPQLPA